MKKETQKIYLDYHSTTPVDRRVMKVMQPFFEDQFGNPHSKDHMFGWEAHKAVERARSQISDLISADSDEIIFTSGATEANNLAIIGTVLSMKPKQKNKIIVSEIEHKCVLNSAAYLKKHDFEVIYLPVDENGRVLPENLESLIDDQTALVSIMAVNNEIGSIQPIEKLGAICHERGVIFHTDAAQAALFMDLDVNEMNIDLLSLSSHKIYGPKGIGALYISRDLKDRPEPIIHGGGQEQGYRSGTLPTMLCAGFGEACVLACSERENYQTRIKELSDLFYTELRQKIPAMQINGSWENRHPGNLNILFPHIDAESLLGALQPYIAASTGSACTTGIPEPSHVLKAIGLTTEQAESSIRFGIGRQTTESDITYAADLIVSAYHNLKDEMALAS